MSACLFCGSDVTPVVEHEGDLRIVRCPDCHMILGTSQPVTFPINTNKFPIKSEKP